MLEIPKFNSKKELFNFLHENKNSLISQKKSITKHADGFSFCKNENIKNEKSFKNTTKDIEQDVINVKAVINTTNILDSHGDVHIPNIWNKSIKENKRIMHLQEHQSYRFDKIIADGADLKVYTRVFNWKDLGFNYEGKTEALMFDSKVRKSRNKFMFEHYKQGYVKNHSVGMQYVKYVLCINSEEEEHKEEKDNYNKYINQIINKEQAEEKGYFWAVLEAKILEGSAVPIGSNELTPTYSVEAGENKSLQEAKEVVKENTSLLDFYKNIKLN